MNVYDFDGTIYRGDSSVDFFLYCLKRHRQLIKYIPKFVIVVIHYKCGKLSKTHLKEVFFSFLADLPDTSVEIASFWDLHLKNISSWYLLQRLPDDLIISASPEFLLSEACKRLGISFLIASEVDLHSGLFLMPNCRGSEKVKRFQAEFSTIPIDNFYSDSIDADAPLAKLAKRAWLVCNNSIQPLPTRK